jgi:hypothetical protein
VCDEICGRYGRRDSLLGVFMCGGVVKARPSRGTKGARCSKERPFVVSQCTRWTRRERLWRTAARLFVMMVAALDRGVSL